MTIKNDKAATIFRFQPAMSFIKMNEPTKGVKNMTKAMNGSASNKDRLRSGGEISDPIVKRNPNDQTDTWKMTAIFNLGFNIFRTI